MAWVPGDAAAPAAELSPKFEKQYVAERTVHGLGHEFA